MDLDIDERLDSAKLVVQRHVDTITNAAASVDRDLITEAEFEAVVADTLAECVREVMS